MIGQKARARSASGQASATTSVKRSSARFVEDRRYASIIAAGSTKEVGGWNEKSVEKWWTRNKRRAGKEGEVGRRGKGEGERG
jgi:hypothetical protein